MADFWITTHWPVPQCSPSLSRHVYFKRGKRATLPLRGDIILFRESRGAIVDGKPVCTVIRHYRNERKPFPLPAGSGGLVGTATVCGDPRVHSPDDVVFDYGNLSDWLVVPCENFRPAVMSIQKLGSLLRRQPGMFLNLWKIDDPSLAITLLKALNPPYPA